MFSLRLIAWTLVAVTATCALCDASAAESQPVRTARRESKSPEFNENMLFGNISKKELESIANGGVALPGKYRADVYLNNYWLGRMDIRIDSVVCSSRNLLQLMGVERFKLDEKLQSTYIVGPAKPRQPA